MRDLKAPRRVVRICKVSKDGVLQLPRVVLEALDGSGKVEVVADDGVVQIRPVLEAPTLSVEERLEREGLTRAEAIRTPGRTVRLRKRLAFHGVDLDKGQHGRVVDGPGIHGKVSVSFEDESGDPFVKEVFENYLELV